LGLCTRPAPFRRTIAPVAAWKRKDGLRVRYSRLVIISRAVAVHSARPYRPPASSFNFLDPPRRWHRPAQPWIGPSFWCSSSIGRSTPADWNAKATAPASASTRSNVRPSRPVILPSGNRCTHSGAAPSASARSHVATDSLVIMRGLRDGFVKAHPHAHDVHTIHDARA
jgi:hypothetical protein